MDIHHLIVGPLATNCYLVSSGENRDTVIIDPGDDASMILKELKKRDLKAIAILNTHGHIDHIGAAKQLQDELAVPTFLHEEDLYWVDLLKAMAFSFGLHTAEKPRIDRLMKDGDIIALADEEIHVIHTPGHTAGGVTFRIGDSLFVGDTLFAGSIGRTDLPGGSFETLIASIKKRLFTLDGDMEVLPGHGPGTSLRNERMFNPFLQ